MHSLLEGSEANLKICLIQKYAEELAVKELCEYFKVSRSGYYSWIKALLKRRQREQQDQALAAVIRECQKKSDKTYGYRRVRKYADTVSNAVPARVNETYPTIRMLFPCLINRGRFS